MEKEKKLAIVRFFNAYGLREFSMLLKYNKISLTQKKSPMLISSIDDRRNTQGFSDRLNGIISIYGLSKATNTPFKIVYTHPFQLTEFLIPNLYNWLPQENELSNSTRDVRFKILRKQRTLARLLSLFPIKKQIRVYANYNYLEEINQLYSKNYTSGELFHELFKPTKELADQIKLHREKIGEKYIACVFRFQSLLGDFKEYDNRPATEKEQDILIEQNKKALIDLTKKNDCQILVTSDSLRFISEIKSLKNIYTLPGKVVHLDCSFGEQKEVYMKSFLDFFMIANAQKVYSIGTKIMYPTSFPMFAAKINNVPFERIILE